MIATNPRPSALARRMRSASLKFTTPNRVRNASTRQKRPRIIGREVRPDRRRWFVSCCRLCLVHEHDERHADDRGDERDEEQWTDVARVPPSSSYTPRPMRGPHTAPAVSAARWKPNARPRRWAGVSSAMSASRGDVRMPLPVRSTTRATSTNGHTLREADEWLRQRRQAIAERDEWASLAHVGEPSRHDLHCRRDAFAETLDEPDHRHRCAEHAREKQRQHRVQHLRGRVLEERDPRQHNHVARQPLRGRRILGIRHPASLADPGTWSVIVPLQYVDDSWSRASVTGGVGTHAEVHGASITPAVSMTSIASP